ncbi:hypothetical protein CHCC20335_3825 [Bacillus paralicheniformis]|nr:hypothetical protein CHCC20335_3825 [Bacillus paralicheniformis]
MYVDKIHHSFSNMFNSTASHYSLFKKLIFAILVVYLAFFRFFSDFLVFST